MPDRTLYQYSPDNVTVTIGGFDISGFQDGTFLDVEASADRFTYKVGSRGSVVRTKNLDETAKFTLTLQAQATSNDDLITLMLSDDTFTIQIKDSAGNMFVHDDEAWVMKIPKIERGKESGPCQWIFMMPFCEMRPGGNVVTL